MSSANQSMGISLVEKIWEEILLSRLPPGQKLAVGALGERHACGASPVREALNQLASDGLVVRIDKRGFFVSTISREEFEYILDNRCFLESEGLRRSIQNGGQDWEERVLVDHFRLNALPRTTKGPDGQTINREWEAAHRRYHMSLLSACGSPILLANCEKLHELNNRYRYFSRQREGPQREGRQRQITDDHMALRDLALSRQTDAAVDLLVRHYRSTGQTIFDDDTTEPGMPLTATGRLTNSKKENLV
jgi:DNA-binding GntR family transcriptional regulator